jgi:predicted phage-related endonuclease
MGNRKAYDALAEARAAAEAEGLFEPTPEQRKMLTRLRDVTRMMKKHEEEATAIKTKILSDMAEQGARGLVENGKNVVLIVPKTASEFYADQMKAEYPNIVAMYVEAKAAYDAHVPEFTFRVQATPANTFPGIR